MLKCPFSDRAPDRIGAGKMEIDSLLDRRERNGHSHDSSQAGGLVEYPLLSAKERVESNSCTCGDKIPEVSMEVLDRLKNFLRLRDDVQIRWAQMVPLVDDAAVKEQLGRCAKSPYSAGDSIPSRRPHLSVPPANFVLG